jgi:uncharacterized protein YndB with AHSA1/START domain
MAIAEHAADTIEIRRIYPTPPEAVWRAWTTPEAMSRWFRPSDDYVCTVHALEVRVGGAYRLELADLAKGVRHVVGGVYRELAPPSRLAFTWRWETNLTMSDTLVTVELNPQGTGTELLLTHRRLTDEKLREEHRYGWTGCLERLGAIL